MSESIPQGIKLFDFVTLTNGFQPTQPVPDSFCHMPNVHLIAERNGLPMLTYYGVQEASADVPIKRHFSVLLI